MFSADGEDYFDIIGLRQLGRARGLRCALRIVWWLVIGCLGLRTARAQRPAIVDLLRPQCTPAPISRDSWRSFVTSTIVGNGTRDCGCTKRANEEHHQMLELCRKRDVAGASTLLREHIVYAGESLKQALELKRTSARVNSRNGKSRSKS